MKTALVVFVLCLSALVAQAQKQELSEKHLPKRKWHHWKEKLHTKLCKNLECQSGEGCKVLRNGSATCVRCIDCAGAPLHPVCGSDGRQYNSMCHFRQQICLQDKIGLIKIHCHSPCSDCPGSQEFEKKKKLQNSSEKEGDGLRKRKKENKTKGWGMWSSYVQEKRKPKVSPDHCSNVENATLAERLIDWFHVLRADHLREEMEKVGIQQPNFVFKEMTSKDARSLFPSRRSGIKHTSCREPINSMFDFLDDNKNDILDKSEIDEVKNIPYEQCIAKFFDACDQGQDGRFQRMEFCDCFHVVPPCLRKRRERNPLNKDDLLLPGMYMPACDEDGFFMPQQCKGTKTDKVECWCVDRNGGKIEGSTGNCADNTKPEDPISEE